MVVFHIQMHVYRGAHDMDSTLPVNSEVVFISAERRKMQSIHKKRAKKRKQADKTHEHCLGVRERGHEACVISAQWSVEFFGSKYQILVGVCRYTGL